MAEDKVDRDALPETVVSHNQYPPGDGLATSPRRHARLRFHIRFRVIEGGAGLA